jgi:hypothetical protein
LIPKKSIFNHISFYLREITFSIVEREDGQTSLIKNFQQLLRSKRKEKKKVTNTKKNIDLTSPAEIYGCPHDGFFSFIGEKIFENKKNKKNFFCRRVRTAHVLTYTY